MAASSSRRNNQNNRNAASYAEDASRLIRENMRCPVCLEVLLPPIYQCETGHNICYLCVDEVTECPLCKSDYGDTRNYFAEELVNSMTFPCKYEEYGCHKTFLGSQLKDHQSNCECQPYRCPELACQEVIGVHQMAKHLDKHGFKVVKGDVHQASVEILDDHFERKTEYNPWRISAFGAEFYTVSTRSREGLWYFWAYGLGLQKDLKKYSYEIVLYSEEKQIMYRGVIQSLRNNPEDIMRNGNCLITTDQMIKSIRKAGRINCQVFFIQGKNWESSRNMNIKNTKAKKVKKIGQPKEKANKRNIPSTATFTCPILSNQSSIASQLSACASHKSRSPGMSLNGAKSGPANIFSKETIDLNGHIINSKSRLSSNSSNGNNKISKFAKSFNITTRPTNGVVVDDENSFVQRVRETLRCPGCNEVITPPVFQCLIGHNVCHKCRMTRQDCSLCLSPLTDCRNFFAEELLYKTYQRCLYSKHGCKVCLPTAQMKSHEAVCDHAPFECPFNVCRTLLRADDLLEHMKTHQISTVNKELKNEVFVPRNPPSSSVCIIPNILMVDKVAFYPIIVRESDGNWLFYVITHNYPKYRYELVIKKQAKSLAFQGPVLSLRSNHSQIKLKGNALIVTERAVKSLKVYDNLAYQIKIRKIDFPGEGAGGKDSTLNLSSSWVLTPRSGEIVSKTELFANKKTSVSPNDESEDDEDIASSGHRNDVGHVTSDTDNVESDAEDTHSEDQTVSGMSFATSSQDENESECEINSTGSHKSNDWNDFIEPVTISRKSSKHVQTPQRSVSSVTSKKSKKVILPEADHTQEVKLEEQLPKRTAASSTVIPTDYANAACPSLSSDKNNNLENARRRMSLSTESLAVVGTFLPVGNSSERDNRQGSVLTVPISILKPTPSENFFQRGTNSISMHHLKIARGEFEVGSQSSSLIANPLMIPEKILKKNKRARSSSKHRVRLNDQVICCGVSDSPAEEDLNGNTCASKSQTNLRISSGKTSIRTVPSKHVLSVQIRKDDDKSDEPTTTEFQQLKKAVSSNESSIAMIEEVDLLTAKSFNEMTDAVITGSFDVVNSVISLFTSESSKESPETFEVSKNVSPEKSAAE